MATEFGIAWSWNGEVLRKNMTKEEAIDWVTDYLLDGGKPGAFEIIETEYEWASYVPTTKELADSMKRKTEDD